MIIIETILMGAFATYFMDFFAGILVRKKIIYPFISQEAIGRWFLYIFRGRLVHKDIYQTPELKNEKVWCLISHYLIGIALAGVYLLLEAMVPILQEQKWISLMFGIVTVIFPWFWMLPSTGFGFMGSKSPDRMRILRTNLANHINFGLGLFIWVVSIHRFL